MKCANPFCNNKVNEERRHRYNQKTCCSKCNHIYQQWKLGKIPDEITNERKFITMSNGIEIRNDVMGKEISQRLVVFS